MRTKATALVLILAIAVSGCQGKDRAGGTAGTTITVLTLANANANDGSFGQLDAFVTEVSKASDRTLRIESKTNWRKGEATYERGIVQDVRDGKVDLAWVGARVFDQVGVTTFEPLLAPMQVDNHDLQGKVFEAGIPEQMLGGLGTIGLHGVAVLPGPMRKLLSKGTPMVTPDAIRGKKIGIQDGQVAERTFAALGATTVALPRGARINEVDGYEQQLDSINGNHYEEQGAKNVVGNLNLWPRPLVVFTGQRTWDRLSDAQRTALTTAAKNAVAPALSASRDEDADAVADICRNGIALPPATEAQLANLRAATEPVIREMASDPQLTDWVHRIEALRAESRRTDTASCDRRIDIGVSAGVLPDGIYWSLRTTQDAKGCSTLQLRGARVLREITVNGSDIREYEYPGDTATGERELGFVATYRVFRGKFELLEDGATAPLVFDYTFDAKTLTLSNLQGEDRGCDHRVVWTSHPWVKVA